MPPSNNYSPSFWLVIPNGFPLFFRLKEWFFKKLVSNIYSIKKSKNVFYLNLFKKYSKLVVVPFLWLGSSNTEYFCFLISNKNNCGATGTALLKDQTKLLHQKYLDKSLFENQSPEDSRIEGSKYLAKSFGGLNHLLCF